MIGKLLDTIIEAFSPRIALKRAQARAILHRSYDGAKQTRLSGTRPHNRPADLEMLGPAGADQARAWARDLVRNNAYAWGVVDTIVASVVGEGFTIMSVMETQDGEDVETINEQRDSVFSKWCEVCDLTGQLTFSEIQRLAQREMVEAGECMIHIVNVPTDYRGVKRPVPLALELIEADRIAVERDTWSYPNSGGNRIIRGVEIDDIGQPVAYWIYPQHPNDYTALNRQPIRIESKNILHLYRKDRIGQHRGVSWFTPAMEWMRDLGYYVSNEMQAGAVAACASVAVKTETPLGTGGGLNPVPSTADTSDDSGNQYANLEPGAFFYLRPGEDISMINPSRPNSGAEPWIALMLRGIAVGTGLSYEIVARDFSQTNYSSNRASQLEDRRRFRQWQSYLSNHLCQPIWDRFCEAAALVGNPWFPTMEQIGEDCRRYAPVDIQPTSWEWVDPATEQSSTEAAITAFQSTYSEELGSLGRNWRHVFYQRAKEERLLKKLGLVSPNAAIAATANQEQALANKDEAQANNDSVSVESTESAGSVQSEALNGAQVGSLVSVIEQVASGMMPKQSAKSIIAAAFPLFTPQQIESIIEPIMPGSIASVNGTPVIGPDGQPTEERAATGEMASISTQQFNRNRKAIEKILAELTSGETSEKKARVYLSSIGLLENTIDTLIEDALDGSGKMESMQ
jgi:lambda family phage portal protein